MGSSYFLNEESGLVAMDKTDEPEIFKFLTQKYSLRLLSKRQVAGYGNSNIWRNNFCTDAD